MSFFGLFGKKKTEEDEKKPRKARREGPRKSVWETMTETVNAITSEARQECPQCGLQRIDTPYGRACPRCDLQREVDGERIAPKVNPRVRAAPEPEPEPSAPPAPMPPPEPAQPQAEAAPSEEDLRAEWGPPPAEPPGQRKARNEKATDPSEP
ncbi:MAG TPA: hypothetical protein VNZ52_00255 [Candidatus Thermoplasmatota archaeon]|nr:hypothetical protein [Candidatus Thermoplasmatota archaeon]